MDNKAKYNKPTVAHIDWSKWRPTHQATAVFLIKEGQVLLIRKKRGLGNGKICAPGGKRENGETLQACAIREVQEEVALTVTLPVYCGTNLFHFTSGYKLQVDVYKTSNCHGQMKETAEAAPFWIMLDHMPYEKMWADTSIWFHLVLKGQIFTGHYVFEGDTMLDCQIINKPTGSGAKK